MLVKAVLLSFSVLQPGWRLMQQQYVKPLPANGVKWSNGVVEGHVNRLKMLKRQMYGRASFELLRRRVMSPLA